LLRGCKAIGELRRWPCLKQVKMFFDSFFIMPDDLLHAQHRVAVRSGRTSPVTPKSLLRSTREFQVTALMRLRRSGSFRRDVANQFHDAVALGTTHDVSFTSFGRFRAGSVGWLCRNGFDDFGELSRAVQQFFDFFQARAMPRRKKAVVPHFDEAVRQDVLQEAVDSHREMLPWTGSPQSKLRVSHGVDADFEQMRGVGINRCQTGTIALESDFAEKLTHLLAAEDHPVPLQKRLWRRGGTGNFVSACGRTMLKIGHLRLSVFS
jgi:hypothetical protein